MGRREAGRHASYPKLKILLNSLFTNIRRHYNFSEHFSLFYMSLNSTDETGDTKIHQLKEKAPFKMQVVKSVAM